MEIRSFQPPDEADVIKLWNQCDLVKPWNDPRKDIARKLQVDPELFLVGELNTEIIASVMVGYDGHRGWINYLAVNPDYRQQGVGKTLMTHVENLLLQRDCPKINLQIRNTNLEAVSFYRAIGYDIDDSIGMGKRLIVDN